MSSLFEIVYHKQVYRHFDHIFKLNYATSDIEVNGYICKQNTNAFRSLKNIACLKAGVSPRKDGKTSFNCK